MSYIFYNPNPFDKETGDCVIRAISKILNLDWDRVFVDLFLKAYQEKDMMDKNYVWGSYLSDNGYIRHVIPDTCPECYTIKQFCLDHPKGKFIVATGSHVVAVVNGDYYDAWDSGNKTPIYYWQKES
jgi:hypothetical protein